MNDVTISNRVLLSFRCAGGRLMRFSIPRADMTKDAAAAREAMDRIIASEAVITGVGTPATVYSAKLISTERNRII